MKFILPLLTCSLLASCANGPTMKEECEAIGGEFTPRKLVVHETLLVTPPHKVTKPTYSGIKYPETCSYVTTNGSLSERWK